MKKEKQAALMTQQLQLAAVEESAPEACDPVEVATDVDAVPTPTGGRRCTPPKPSVRELWSSERAPALESELEKRLAAVKAREAALEKMEQSAVLRHLERRAGGLGRCLCCLPSVAWTPRWPTQESQEWCRWTSCPCWATSARRTGWHML